MRSESCFDSVVVPIQHQRIDRTTIFGILLRRVSLYGDPKGVGLLIAAVGYYQLRL